MAIRGHMDGGKVINRAQRGSWAHRCSGAVLRYNEGAKWAVMAWQEAFPDDAANGFLSSLSCRRESATKRRRLREANPDLKRNRKKQKFLHKENKTRGKSDLNCRKKFFMIATFTILYESTMTCNAIQLTIHMFHILDLLIIAGAFFVAHDYGPNANIVEDDLPQDLLLFEMQRKYAEVVAANNELASIKQNTPQWTDARRLRLTTSNFKKASNRKVIM